jgi:bacillithiol synthase
MHCTPVRHTDLPGTSRLFADVLDNPARTGAFYRHPRRDAESFRAAAGEIQFPDERRAALIAALRQQNPDSPSLERLAQPGTVVVATGQQVGMFSGPAYSIYKALHAAKLAEWLTANGIPAVPVFWLATEDHDFAEVDHVWVFDSEYQPRRLEMRRPAGAQPAGDVTLVAPPVGELRDTLGGLPFGEEVAALVEETYRPGATMGQAFGDLLRRLLPDRGILQVDPMLPAFRELAAPALRAAVERTEDLAAGLIERNQQLADAGYHAQVHFEASTSLVFLIENGKRLALRRSGSEYLLSGRRFTSEELAAQARWLSPNALLRPVVQDSMMPTVAIVGGPAEVAYFAQSEAIYRAILGRMPVAVPRAGFTVLDARSRKRMERYGLTLADFFPGEDALRQRIASTLAPPEVGAAMRQTAAAVDSAVDRLRASLTGFEPSLAKALGLSARKIHHQLSRIEGKVGREALRRDERAVRDARSLTGLIYPERHLQERIYSFIALLAKHGAGLTGQVYEAIEPCGGEHAVLTV